MEPANPSSTGGGGKNTQNVANSNQECMYGSHTQLHMHAHTDTLNFC